MDQQESDASPQAPTGSARRRRRLVIAGALTVVIAAAVAVSGYVVARGSTSSGSEAPRTSGIPAVISDSTANLMALDALPRQPAPDFTFTDQTGHTLSLSDLRGKAVVLEFLDPHCTDICPIVSQEFVDAYHDLGAAASKVVFVGINVNPFHTSVKAVLDFSREHQLTTIPDWHYFTGPVPRLSAVWHDYHIAVEAPNPKADVLHTSAVYFIDPQGHERYLASPQVDHNASGNSFLPADQITSWGHGIADLARTLVP